MISAILLSLLVSDFRASLFEQPYAKELPEEVRTHASAESFEFSTIPQSELSKSIEMQKTEVTQLQWFLVTGGGISHYRDKARIQADPNEQIGENGYNSDFVSLLNGIQLKYNHPVESISLRSIRYFLERLNKLQSEYTYRLPTEDEWRFAQAAGTQSEEDLGAIHEREIYAANSDTRYLSPNIAPAAVATKKANPYGLFDMLGNLQEWTDTEKEIDDRWHPGHKVLVGVILGCNFTCSESALTKAKTTASLVRDRENPRWVHRGLGFRLVRTKRP